MGNQAVTYLAVFGSIVFGLWYFNKGGCETDITSLCWNGPSLQEMLGDIKIPGLGPTEAEQEQEIEDVGERNDIRQVTPPEKRGIISHTNTSDPVSTGGGVGGPSKPVKGFGSSVARAYYVNNRITVA